MARIKVINKLTLLEMMSHPVLYDGLAAGLEQLPVPELLTITGRKFSVPQTLDEFSDVICYGQRNYLARPEPNDFGIIIRYITGYYFPLFMKKPWDETGALKFGANILHSLCIELFPVSLHMVKLMADLAERELKLLQRDPTAHERAAGIEKLSKFADLTALMFLADSFKCSESDVMLKPYNDCLVRFMLQREQNAFAERLADVYKNESKHKIKSK
jgi:hypothetical protein